MRASAENLLAVINDVLDFSKIEAGKLKLEILPFQFRDLLDQMLNPHLLLTETKKIR